MVKKLAILMFTCLLFSSKVFAQAQLTPVFEIKNDTIQEQILDSVNWQKLEEKEGKLTIDDIRKEPLSGKFHIQTGDTTGIRTHWQRYRIKNVMPRDVKIFLTSSADYFDVYIIKQDAGVKHYRSGILRKWEEKDGLKSAQYTRGAIPVILTAGEEVIIYDRRSGFNNGDITQITVRWLSEQNILNEYIEYVDSRNYIYEESNLHEIFTVGLLFFSFLLSLFFYRSSTEKVYLWFALYAISLACIHFHNVLGSAAHWFRPAWLKYVRLFAFPWTFIPYFLIQFLRCFFVIKQTYPKWDRLFRWTGISSVLVGLAQTIISILSLDFPYFGIASLFLIMLVVPITVIITAFHYILSKNTSFRYIVYGVLPLMLVYLLFFYIFQISGDPGPLYAWGMNKQWLFQLAALCWLVFWFVRVLIMRYDVLKKENAQRAIDQEKERSQLVASQKIQLEIEVAKRTAELKQSIEELKSTQQQLIQSEKMASLGELTAGIAHEIQNPLNFVNNFSEVSTELVDEMTEELATGNTQLANEIANDLKQNLQKINHHGKRAGDIVKGMLAHSRTSSGQKELTDINNLCDEYLRLSYHGLRAKDKSFNATFETDLDKSIEKISIVPQDLGRVILNLINNAFYAVNDRKKQNEPGYEPTVIVSSSKTDKGIEIKVKDNGKGIPKNIVDKIFQPFFTTKPTGEGTGLGLSLSYDIVKAHGGELKVETVTAPSGEAGTSFIIHLPLA
jgi:two-component system, NtrC family, sensor kinase